MKIEKSKQINAFKLLSFIDLELKDLPKIIENKE